MSTDLLYDVAPAGSCKHRPISNGWSQHWSAEFGIDPAEAWCGHCRAVVQLDDEWIEKFRLAGKAIPESASP